MKIAPLQIEHLEMGTFAEMPCLDLRPLEKIPPDFPAYAGNYLYKVQEIREERRNFYRYLVEKFGAVGLAATQRGKCLGWITFFPKEEARRVGWIRAADDYFNKETLVLGCFYVKDGRRNKGVGTALIKAWKEWAFKNYWRYLEAAARGDCDEEWYDALPLQKNKFYYVEERITSLEMPRRFRIFKCDLFAGQVTEWVQIWEDEPLKVQVVKSFLESHGIPTKLESDVVLSVHPFSMGPLGEVRVKVPSEMSEQAQILLKEVEDKEKELFSE